MDKRKVFIIILGFVGICLIFVSILGGVRFWEKDSLARNMSNSIEMEIVEGTVTRSGCDILITDNSADSALWRNEFGFYKIDVLIFNKWKELEPLPGIVIPDSDVSAGAESGVIDIFSSIKPGITEMHVSWSNFYGKLEDGTYRLVKWVGYRDDKEYFYAPFTIDENMK